MENGRLDGNDRSAHGHGSDNTGRDHECGGVRDRRCAGRPGRARRSDGHRCHAAGGHGCRHGQSGDHPSALSGTGLAGFRTVVLFWLPQAHAAENGQGLYRQDRSHGRPDGAAGRHKLQCALAVGRVCCAGAHPPLRGADGIGGDGRSFCAGA